MTSVVWSFQSSSGLRWVNTFSFVLLGPTAYAHPVFLTSFHGPVLLVSILGNRACRLVPPVCRAVVMCHTSSLFCLVRAAWLLANITRLEQVFPLCFCFCFMISKVKKAREVSKGSGTCPQTLPHSNLQMVVPFLSTAECAEEKNPRRGGTAL